MHDIIIIIRARTKRRSIRPLRRWRLRHRDLKGTNWAETTGHTGSGDAQPPSPQTRTKRKKKIKNQKNMDYFVRTQYIHDMKWLDIVHGHSLLCELAFIQHVTSSLLLVPHFMYHMSAVAFHYKAVCKIRAPQLRLHSLLLPQLPQNPGSRPVVSQCLAEPHPPAYRHQHIHVLLGCRGRLLGHTLSRIPWQWAAEGELTLTEGVGAGCQLPYLFHQTVAVGSEQGVLLSAVGGHAGGLLGVSSPVRPSSSTAPSCVGEAHPLWRSPHVVTSRWVITIQKLLAARAMLRRASIPRRIWHCGGLNWHDWRPDGNGARGGWRASHSSFGGWCPANGGRPRGDGSGAASPCTIRSSLQGLTRRQTRCTGRPLGLDHAPVALSDVTVAWDGGGLVKVCLSFTVSIPIERVALIIRT